MALINARRGLIVPPENTVRLGVSKIVWFSTLKHSDRNCMAIFR